jgi:Tol biopolymer transport system component
MLRRARRVVAHGLLVAVGAALPAWAQGTAERIGVEAGGDQGNGESDGPVLSAAGRFVAFTSRAGNLVPGDTNGRQDVFVRDRQKGTTARVSVGTGDGQGNRESWEGELSADGRFVAFTSFARNLVPGDTNGFTDVFVRDRQTGTTERVSVGAGGQGDHESSHPALSADGRFVAFGSFASNLVPGDTNDSWDVFVRDRRTGRTERVSVSTGSGQGRGGSSSPTLSADGRFVAFHSHASNLVPGDTNGRSDVFVHDRQTGRTERTSVRPGGAPTLSAIPFHIIKTGKAEFQLTVSERPNPQERHDGTDINSAATPDVRDVAPSCVHLTNWTSTFKSLFHQAYS